MHKPFGTGDGKTLGTEGISPFVALVHLYSNFLQIGTFPPGRRRVAQDSEKKRPKSVKNWISQHFWGPLPKAYGSSKQFLGEQLRAGELLSGDSLACGAVCRKFPGLQLLRVRLLFRDVTAFEPSLHLKETPTETHCFTKPNLDSIVTTVCHEFSMWGE